MYTANTAVSGALAAMSAISAGDRSAWLACFADDAALYDPVGGSPLDPRGDGLHGRPALEQFWDGVVGPREVEFTVSATHPAGAEVAVVASVALRTRGDATTVSYDGVFVYRTDSAGRIASLRAYWDIQRVLAGLAGA